MSARMTVVYPPVKKFKAGTGPCPELGLDYLYSEQDKTWLVAGNVYVEKRRTKTNVRKFDKDYSLRTSGLLGPVQIIISSKVPVHF